MRCAQKFRIVFNVCLEIFGIYFTRISKNFPQFTSLQIQKVLSDLQTLGKVSKFWIFYSKLWKVEEEKFCENRRRRKWGISSWKLTDVSAFQVSRDFTCLRSLFSQPSALRGARIQQTEDSSYSAEKITSCSSLWLLLR